MHSISIHGGFFAKTNLLVGVFVPRGACFCGTCSNMPHIEFCPWEASSRCFPCSFAFNLRDTKNSFAFVSRKQVNGAVSLTCRVEPIDPINRYYLKSKNSR